MDSKKGAGTMDRKKIRQYIFPLFAAAILLGAFAAYIFAIAGVSEPKMDSCAKIIESLNKKELIEGADMNPLKVQSCRMQACEFDLTQCEIQCPLSYETNEEDGCPSSCDCATEGYYQGDVIFTPQQVDGILQKYGHETKTDFNLFFATAYSIWNEVMINGRAKVPYMIDGAIETNTITAWNGVVKEFAEKTCIDFIHKSTEKDFLIISHQTVNCASGVGKVGGTQSLEIGIGCGIRATIQHELLHALGFEHEQSRPDRDSYVNILTENIHSYMLHNFDKMKESQILDLGSEYETNSTLHYRSDDFGISGKYSLTLKPDDRAFLTHSRDRLMTAEDVRELNLLYKCKTENYVAGTWQLWSSWTECSVTCKEGIQVRTRDCHDNQGNTISNCAGPGGTFEYIKCDLGKCPPPEGVFEEWGEWMACDEPCGIGKQKRYRHCPEEYVDGCVGFFKSEHHYEEKTCRLKTCDGKPNSPVDVFWNDWWITVECNATCGGGFTSWVKNCFCETVARCHVYNCAPDYDFAGLGAQDWLQYEIYKWEPCNTHLCDPLPAPPKLTTTTTTPLQTLSQTTTTVTSNPVRTPGPRPTFSMPTQKPPDTGSWSGWSPWGICDKICGNGHQTRIRECIGGFCSGRYFSVTPCNVGACIEVFSDNTEYESIPVKDISSEYSSDNPDRNSYGRNQPVLPVKLSRGLDTITQSVEDFCTKGKLLVGYFNADKLQDFLCYHNDGLLQLHLLSEDKFNIINKEVSWEGRTTMCNGVDDIKVEDIDNDGLEELICRNPMTSNIEILRNLGGSFGSVADWTGQRDMCKQPTDVLNVVDLNADGKGDLVCGDANYAVRHFALHYP